ncbi:MAG: HAD-IB family hydrolase [Deltaproteobacteria bacterium]|nr:HAD-IB family hydrolase [Deltaproteobacteria bacterium]
MKTIAFFDVDGTLVNGYTGYYASVELIRRKIIKKRRLPLALLYRALSAVFFIKDVAKMYEVALQDLAGTRVEEIMAIGQLVFERDVKKLVYQEGLGLIKQHQNAGNQVVLISSGPYLVIKALEKFVGANTSFSIGPQIENGILQKKLDLPIAYMEGKRQLAERYAKSQGLNLEDCSHYADTRHDLPLLEAVGQPHLVNPDASFTRLAERRSWPVLRFKTMLG